MNYLNAVRVGGSALSPTAWAGKHAAAATIAALIPLAVSFLPPQYAQYFDQNLVQGVSYTLASVLAAFGVLGTTDKIGVMPTKSTPESESPKSGEDNLSSGA